MLPDRLFTLLLSSLTLVSPLLPPSSRIEKTTGREGPYERYGRRMGGIEEEGEGRRREGDSDNDRSDRSDRKRSTAAPFQDYPDYELPVRQPWPPPQEQPVYPPYPERRAGSRVLVPESRVLAPLDVRPVESYRGPPPEEDVMPLQAPGMEPEFLPNRPLPVPRYRSRRPNDVWVRTNGAYPELINLRSLGQSLPNIGLPPISEPATPLLPVENFPNVPYPNLPGYPVNQGPYEGYGTYRSRPPPLRIVDPDTGYGRYIEQRPVGRPYVETRPPPAYGRGGGEEYERRGPGNGGYRSYPPPERERSTWRNIPSPYGYSYAGYIERQSRMYPIMIYTLELCPACHSAKRLLAVNYADIASHFLELTGEEEWQRQLHIDLQNLTGAGKFPYIFVCGRFIGGSADLHEMHRRGSLRMMLQECTRPYNKEMQ